MKRLAKWAMAACALLALSLAAAPAAQAEGFTGADLLKWDRENQSFYFRASVGMAGLIAARNDKGHSDCVDRWYFSDTERGDAAIVDAVRKFPGHHPQAVILAMILKACGPYTHKQE